jgi:hypothetical protein
MERHERHDKARHGMAWNDKARHGMRHDKVKAWNEMKGKEWQSE